MCIYDSSFFYSCLLIQLDNSHVYLIIKTLTERQDTMYLEVKLVIKYLI